MQKKAKKAAGQLGKQVKPAVQGMLKDPKRMQSLVKGAQGLLGGGKMNFGNLRNQLMGQKSPIQSAAPIQPPMASAPSIPAQVPKPSAPAISPIQPPLAAEQSRAVGPAEQEQQMKSQLMPPTGAQQNALPAGQPSQAGQQPQNAAPMGQPPQGAEAPAQDGGALDQQIAALQKQIADLQAQKK